MKKRRSFLIYLLISLLCLSTVTRAKDNSGSGSSNSGSGSSGSGSSGSGGSNSGSGNSGGDGDNSGSGSNNSGSGSGGNDDDDERDEDHNSKGLASAVERGEIAPVSSVIRAALAHTQGKIIDVNLRRRGRSFIYQVKILTPNGRKRELYLEARTRQVLRVK
jgi:hypothetical protein